MPVETILPTALGAPFSTERSVSGEAEKKGLPYTAEPDDTGRYYVLGITEEQNEQIKRSSLIYDRFTPEEDPEQLEFMFQAAEWP